MKECGLLYKHNTSKLFGMCCTTFKNTRTHNITRVMKTSRGRAFASGSLMNTYTLERSKTRVKLLDKHYERQKKNIKTKIIVIVICSLHLQLLYNKIS